MRGVGATVPHPVNASAPSIAETIGKRGFSPRSGLDGLDSIGGPFADDGLGVLVSVNLAHGFGVIRGLLRGGGQGGPLAAILGLEVADVGQGSESRQEGRQERPETPGGEEGHHCPACARRVVQAWITATICSAEGAIR